MLPAMVDKLSGGSRDTFGKAERHPWISFGWCLGDREHSFMQAYFPDAVPLLRWFESILRGRSWLMLPPGELLRLCGAGCGGSFVRYFR